jgi:hypothetical protein
MPGKKTAPKRATKPRIPGMISRKPGHKFGVMNATEKAYAALLQAKLEAKEIIYYGFEEVTLKIAPSVRYTPDFIVIYADGAVRFHEVKGTTGKVGHLKPYYHNAAGRVKVEVAASKFPFIFVVVFKARGATGFIEQEVE